MSYKVKLKAFEGPFDLLVYLIESAEMSIYDIKISEITSEYLAYIQGLKEQNINVSSEFMVLAASLIEIKSKMILPRMTTENGEIIEEDPRTELVERILEYKKYKLASELLAESEERMQRIFQKPQEDISVYLENPDEYLSLDLKEFANAFNMFLQKKQKIEAVRKHYTRVERERSSMQNTIRKILEKVRTKLGQVVSFKDLINDKKNRYDIVVTFSSVLEMAKEQVINVDQKSTYGNIEITSGVKVNEDAILNKYQENAGENAQGGQLDGN